jgi:hypothetical protein
VTTSTNPVRVSLVAFGVAAGLILGACARGAGNGTPEGTAASPPPAASADGAPQAAALELDRGACRGRCPQYRLALFDDGVVHFDGGTNVLAVGVHRRTVAPSSVQALFTRFRAPVLALGDSEWTEGSAACGAFVTDLPTMHLVVRTGNAVRRFTVSSGCRNAPALLHEFARAIDSVAIAPTWIGGRSR